MKSLVFDAGPIISMTMNNLLWLLDPLMSQFKGDFYITEAVKREVVDRPLKTKKFKFEALQVLQQISKDVLKVYTGPELKIMTDELMQFANNSFMAKGQYIKIVHYAEMEALAACIKLGSAAFVCDERTTRYLIERPDKEVERLRRKLHTKIRTNKENLDKFKELVKDIKVIRSIELVTIAYEHGLLNLFTTEKERELVPDLNRHLLDAVLWGVKLQGCAVSANEIEDILKFEMQNQ